LGLSSQSFGMGTDRRIHIFMDMASSMTTLEPVKYSVKNTFVDGHMDSADSQKDLLGPNTKSMPVGTFQEQLATQDGPGSLQSDTDSTAESESQSPTLEFSIKNTFVHFEETDVKEYEDPRIIQSMPNGKFTECIKSDMVAAAAAAAGSAKRRPGPLSNYEDVETEVCSGMLFPATPNAEMTFDSTPERFPEYPIPMNARTDAQACMTTALQPAMLSSTALPPTMATQPSTTVLQPAMFVRESSTTVLPPAMMGQEACTIALPPAVWSLPAPMQANGGFPAVPLPPPTLSECSPPTTVPAPMPPQGSPPCLAPGMPVVLCGLASQPAFNGLRGKISSFDAECGRYNIALEVVSNKPQMVKVKHQNLLLAQPQPICCPHALQPQPPVRSRLVLDHML